ncbi:MAG: hypothetical protein LGR52_00960 [Candidatus Thiosymbion ectosymbiont of Robbea hypermnestra]|nr:hypothetical protein [Candidatus Thiosymbion ectosymbiont of Robbea hypermnestra]
MAQTQPLPPAIEQIAHKLQRLSQERVNEVEDFVDFLSRRDSDRQLIQAALTTSEPILNAIWDNPDDGEYDRL